MALIGQYKRVEMNSKQTVNVRRYNRVILKRKLRLASFVSAVRLVKGFHNRPTVEQ